MMNTELSQRVDQLPLLQKLFSIGWECGAFSDVVLSAFGQQYKAHRILLCQSQFFERLLCGQWSDSHCETLELVFEDPHIGPDVFLIALQYLYGQSVNLDVDNVHGTLAIGCFLGLEPLCERCVDFVGDNLSLKTFERFYLFCSRYDYGIYSRRVKDLCLDFLRMHAYWEARAVVKDLDLVDAQALMCDDVLWVPTEVERFLMLQDAFESEEDIHSCGDSPMSCQTTLSHNEYPTSIRSTFTAVLKDIRFEHFPERSLQNLMSDKHEVDIHESLQCGIRIQSQFRELLGNNANSFSHKLTRHFRSFRSSASLSPRDLINRSFRMGIEFDDLADVFKTKGLGSCEYFYAGSLWRIHIVQRRQSRRPESNEYIGVFVHRRPAANSVGSWSDVRTSVEASLRLRIGWGPYKVDKTCQGKFEPDSWNSFGWPNFIRKSQLERVKQPDGALRLAFRIKLVFD